MSHERRLQARLIVLLPAMALGLRLFGFRRMYQSLARRSVPGSHGWRPADEQSAAEAGRLAAAVVHVNRRVFPFEARCLLESLALWWLLRRRRIDAELLLGVRTIVGPFESHAWVEYGGQVLNDATNVREVFEPFALDPLAPDLPTSRPW